MGNARLRMLLERSPLSEEDRHNIMVIFDALGSERQYEILEHWDKYIVDIVMMKKEVESANRALLDEALELIDTLHDAKNLHDAETRYEKFLKQKQTRLALDEIHNHEKTKKLNLIRSIAQLP